MPFQVQERALVGETWQMNDHPEIVLLVDREARRSWYGRLLYDGEQFASNAQVLKTQLAVKWHRVRAAYGVARGSGHVVTREGLSHNDAVSLCERLDREAHALIRARRSTQEQPTLPDPSKRP